MRFSVLHAPILSKELLEQAARPRTYALRVAYATLLCGVFVVSAYNMTQRFELGDSVAGSGHLMFMTLVYAQFVGIVLFLPALMSGAITEEKERRTLELLLLTGLRPRHILWEKYVGRLIPVLTFLILSLPLLGICYAFGGLTTDHLLVGAYVLFLTCLQVGALALMCSAWCRTSLGAFFASYALLALLYVLGPLADAPAKGTYPGVLFALSPYSVLSAGEDGGFELAFGRSFEVIGSVLMFLGLTRLFLLRRALAGPRRLLARAFRRLDGFLARHGLSKALRWHHCGHLRPREDLPDRQPIAWREVAKTPVVKPAHLAYAAVLLEVLVLFALGIIEVSAEPRGLVIVLLGVLWMLATAAVLGLSVNAVSTERSSQTLEVLLTTPIAGRDIVRQKLHGVRRIISAFLVPFGTITLMQILWLRYERVSWRAGLGVQQLSYMFLSFAAVALFLWLFAWFSMLVGLRTPSRSRAVLTSVVGLLVWSAVPLMAFAAALWGTSFYFLPGWQAFLLLVSPVGCLWAVQVYPGPYWEVSEGIGLMMAALVLHAGLLFLFRFLCLRRADRYLGRARPRRRWTSGGFLYAPPEE